MSFSSDVDLKAVADMCEYFTGADLKALLYNSQLSAMHDGDTVPFAVAGTPNGTSLRHSAMLDNDTVPCAADMSATTECSDTVSSAVNGTSRHSAVDDNDTVSSARNDSSLLCAVRRNDTVPTTMTDITYIPSVARGPVEIDRNHYEQLAKQVVS